MTMKGALLMGTTFANRLKQALKLRNMTAAELARLTNTPESVISQYKKGLYEPKQKRLQQFSEILDVSIPWLMGADTPIDGTNNKFINLENEQENHIIKNYRNLNQDGQAKLIDYSDDLVSSGRYNKEETVKVFMSARNWAKPGIVEIKKSLMDKIKNAPTVESDDDI